MYISLQNEMHHRSPKELADVVAKSLYMRSGKSQQSGEVPGNWKKGKYCTHLSKG